MTMYDKFFIFNENKPYDQDGLEEHLEYLQEWGGDPDMWEWKYTLEEAKQEAYNFCQSTHNEVVVTNEDWEIVWRVQWDEAEQKPDREPF